MDQKLPARDLLAFSDAELDSYLAQQQQQQRSNGATILEVEGFETLPEDQRDRLCKRLRERTQIAQNAVQARPLDLDQVTARLLALSGESAPPTAQREHVPTPPPLEMPENLREEARMAYNELVSDGCQPWYPISLLDDISENPRQYDDVLEFWGRGDGVRVFELQLDRWTEFRVRQRDNRGLADPEGDYAAFVERVRGRSERLGDKWNIAKYQDKAWVAKEYHEWLSWRYQSRSLYPYIGTYRDDVFSNYAKAVKDQLDRHGVTHPIELDVDPKQQDKLTTWIEYLAHECWWHGRHLAREERERRKDEEAWKKLVDSGVLGPEETPTSLSSTDTIIRDREEKSKAQEAVLLAKSSAASVLAETDGGQNDPSYAKQRKQRLLEAQARLDAAEASAERLAKRVRCLSEYWMARKHYRGDFENSSNHEILLRWIQEQIPVIEDELRRDSAAAAGKSGTGDADKQTAGEGRASSERADQANQVAPPAICSTASQTSTKPSKRTLQDETGDGKRSPKRFKSDSSGSTSPHVTLNIAPTTPERRPKPPTATRRSKQTRRVQTDRLPSKQAGSDGRAAGRGNKPSGAGTTASARAPRKAATPRTTETGKDGDEPMPKTLARPAGRTNSTAAEPARRAAHPVEAPSRPRRSARLAARRAATRRTSSNPLP